jgi:hypothetical protein
MMITSIVIFFITLKLIFKLALNCLVEIISSLYQLFLSIRKQNMLKSLHFIMTIF